jgi:hypothetical protein
MQLKDNVKSRIIDQCQANIYRKTGNGEDYRCQFEIWKYYKELAEKHQ